MCREVWRRDRGRCMRAARRTRSLRLRVALSVPHLVADGRSIAQRERAGGARNLPVRVPADLPCSPCWSMLPLLPWRLASGAAQNTGSAGPQHPVVQRGVRNTVHLC